MWRPLFTVVLYDWHVPLSRGRDKVTFAVCCLRTRPLGDSSLQILSVQVIERTAQNGYSGSSAVLVYR